MGTCASTSDSGPYAVRTHQVRFARRGEKPPASTDGKNVKFVHIDQLKNSGGDGKPRMDVECNRHGDYGGGDAKGGVPS